MKPHVSSGARATLAGALASIIGLSALSAANAEPAKAKASATHTPCFFLSQWQGWKAPNDHTLYLAVNFHDVYQVDLAGGSSTLQEPDARLINRAFGSNDVCTALDLQLSVADLGGFPEPLFPSHLTKLTPEQVAAIPKKYRPY
jgi:hypothetical protein